MIVFIFFTLETELISLCLLCVLCFSLFTLLLKVVSPTISSPVCQEQLIEAGKLVDRSVESCVQACLSATEDGELLKQVSLINVSTDGALNSIVP